MRTAVVSSSALGVNCWSARRFTNSCHRCERYDICNYPERVANVEYDEMRAEALRLRHESDALYKASKEIR